MTLAPLPQPTSAEDIIAAQHKLLAVTCRAVVDLAESINTAARLAKAGKAETALALVDRFAGIDLTSFRNIAAMQLPTGGEAAA